LLTIIHQLRLEGEKCFGDTASAPFNIVGRMLDAVAQNALVREGQPNRPRVYANAARVNPAVHISLLRLKQVINLRKRVA
jgi:hypothetical protein